MPGKRSKSVEYYGTPSSLPFRIFSRVISSLQWVAGLAVFLMSIRFITTYDYPFPKSFYVLIAVSGLTLLAIPLSGIASCWRGMSPRTSLAINIALSILWAVGFAIGASRLINVVYKECPSGELDKIPVGVHVCRTFTIIFIGAICGIAFSIAAFVCDMVASRRQVPRAGYKYTQACMSGPEATSYQSKEPLYNHQAASL